MAEQSVHDVVNQEQSVGDLSPSDASATKTNHQTTGGEGGEDQAAGENGFASQQRPISGTSESTRLKFGHSVVPNGLATEAPEATNSPQDQSSTAGTFRTRSEERASAIDGSNLADNISVSDTDTSRADLSAAEDGKGQEQPAALKKAASFKPVTFAKQKLFPVSKGVGAAAAAVKSAENKANIPSASSSTTSLVQGTRPRLVAKSNSGLGNSAKNSKASGRNGAIPDPMQVWNKNRVTPQTSTKHLTDEELKQQYGIHMTSRIQADGEGKESKWADIDDDEDDWAPETIEWGDGTKVTVNQADAIPAASQIGKPEPTTTDEGKPAQPVKVISPVTTTTIGPNATVLRLGASAERQQAQKAAILQKGPTEKPIQSTTKAPAPPPSKSPWAPLPPVDKVSPIAINPQLSGPPPIRYFNNQGSLQSPSAMASQSPAKEISADDFNRSWRESQSGQPRELYMPNSGRYEAVNESRRRGSRNDQGFRAPAVLQRPSQSDQHTPAEPSAAFQTHRSSTEQDRAPWARRRASSSLSTTSGQYGRRMSVSKPGERDLSAVSSEALQERRGSHATASDSVGSQDMPPPPVPNAVYRPQGFSPAQQMLRQPSFNADQIQPTLPSSAPAADLEAERALQKQLMREKRELAIKRRQEEEAKLEAEKKERIRLKLEALGPPPEKAKQQEQPVASQDAFVSATQPGRPTQSPPKPPIPEASGRPTQYGMMKLHPPDVIRAPASVEQLAEAAAPILPASDTSRPLSEPALNVPKIPPAMTNGVRPTAEPQPTKLPTDAPLDDRVVQPSKAGTLASESRSPWPSSRVDHRPPPTNLWGPPTNNKALGNGTFDQSLASFPSGDFGPREPAWKNGRLAAERSPQLMPASHVPMDRTPSLPSFPASEQSPLAANSEVDSVLPQSRPAPIGPPQAQQASQRWQASPNMRPSATAVAAWNNFPSVVAQEERAESERAQQELAMRREEEARTGVRRAPQYNFNETWKQAETGDQAGQRQITGIAQSNFNPAMLPGTQFGAVGSLPLTDLGSRPVNGLPLRSSRFFPQPADSMPAQNRRAVTYSHPEPSSDSPPPPPAEEFGSLHPAYDGDFQRPIVHLPPTKPVVKLPPPTCSPPPSVSTLPVRPPPVATPLSFAAAVKTQPAPQAPPPVLPPTQPSLRTVSTPIASTTSWQDRFNGLLGRQTKPEKKDQVLAVTSSSKEPLDVPPINVLASVSLPQLEEDFLIDAGKVTSKDVEDEEEIFEDRETGDLPTIKMPQALPTALPVAPTPFARPKARLLPQLIDPLSVMPLVAELLGEQPRNGKKGDFVIIHLPGSAELRKDLPRKDSLSSASRSKTSRNTPSTLVTKHKRGGAKSREPSATHSQSSQGGKNGQSQQPQPNGSVPSPRPAQHQGHRFRGGRQAVGVAH